MKMRNLYKVVFAIYLIVSISSAAFAIDPMKEEKLKKLTEELAKASVDGPSTVNLLDQATLNLPKGYSFFPRKEAGELMEIIGHPKRQESFVGIIGPDANVTDEQWLITLDFIKSGYINDSDANNLNNNELLLHLEKVNLSRSQKVENPIKIEWEELPYYDRSTHRLTWSVKVENGEEYKGFSNNYASLLGRDGFFQVDYTARGLDKSHFQEVLNALHYNDSKRYESFVPGHDKVARFTLAHIMDGMIVNKAGGFFIYLYLMVVFVWLIKSIILVIKWFRKKRTL